MKCPHLHDLSVHGCAHPRCLNSQDDEFNTICRAEHAATTGSAWVLTEEDRDFLRSVRIDAEA